MTKTQAEIRVVRTNEEALALLKRCKDRFRAVRDGELRAAYGAYLADYLAKEERRAVWTNTTY